MFESNCLDRASASENTRLGSTKRCFSGTVFLSRRNIRRDARDVTRLRFEC